MSCVYRLPEIPNDTPETNPVLRTEELLDYTSISAEKCLNAVAKLSLEQESGIWKLENQLTGIVFGYLSLTESSEILVLS